MARLIDADALKESILKERDKIPLTVPAAPYEFVSKKANSHGNAMRGGIRVALRCMEHTPTIDAEPVVRCKDCNYARPYDCKYVTCLCHPTFIHYSPVDGYCYLGKKVDGGAEDG